MNVFKVVSESIQKAKDTSREIHPDDRLKEDLQLDSFDSLMIVCELEDVFNITVKPEELKVLVTVQDIVDSLVSRIEETTHI